MFDNKNRHLSATAFVDIVKHDNTQFYVTKKVEREINDKGHLY